MLTMESEIDRIPLFKEFELHKLIDREKEKAVPQQRVLVVEDDSTQAALWETILFRVDRHAQMVWATSESQASDLITESLRDNRPFDAVIADIFLAGQRTGIDLWFQFHSALKGKMALSSSLEYTKFIRWLRGTETLPLFLPKPLVLAECIEVLYGLLHRRS